MYDRVEADYEQLEQVVARFNNQAQETQQMMQNVRSSMGNLESGGWEGRGSDAFFAEMNGEVLPATERLHQALEEAARVTKFIMQTMKQAEEEASSPFRAR